LVRVLYPARLQTGSKITRVEVGASAVFLYDAMVPRIHAALTAQGQDAGIVTDSYSAKMVAAVRRFQGTKGLPQTGLPDQITLNALFP
jgi:murein L,D-transpeptidase YcbB/YkuD